MDITIPRPDDWHLHLRDGPMLAAVLPASARHFGRALIMPNLKPPVADGAAARAYRERILAALPQDAGFVPLMTLYLTEASDAEDLARAHAEGVAFAAKLYPAGATTNSDAGVRDIARVMPVLERMEKIGMPLCIHGEVVDPEVDIFDREAVFIDRVLAPLRRSLPGLRIVLEHVTTREGVDFVRAAGPGLGATITAHHLILNRNHLLAGGIRPHYYCLPVAKRERHRRALVLAATSGDPRFFFGSDSAPHPDHLKEHACGCAGCYTAPVALACLAAVFEAEGRLDRLGDFAGRSGAAFHGLPPARATLTLRRSAEPPRFDAKIAAGTGQVTVFDPGFPLNWSVLP
jgi:dihydroorotase